MPLLWADAEDPIDEIGERDGMFCAHHGPRDLRIEEASRGFDMEPLSQKLDVLQPGMEHPFDVGSAERLGERLERCELQRIDQINFATVVISQRLDQAQRASLPTRLEFGVEVDGG
jgi:hypothetical protein